MTSGSGRRGASLPAAWTPEPRPPRRPKSRNRGIDFSRANGKHDSVSTSDPLSGPPLAGERQTRLRCSFAASDLRRALRIATELRKITAAAHVRRGSQSDGWPGWIVTLTTPQLPLTLDVIELWEGRMLAAERMWPGCRFLGWTTSHRTDAPLRCAGETPEHAASGPGQRRSQRELVVASLLRCPPGERRGIVRGRAVPR